jgi:hypothetical protein
MVGKLAHENKERDYGETVLGAYFERLKAQDGKAWFQGAQKGVPQKPDHGHTETDLYAQGQEQKEKKNA